jgi:hypothetical protein
MLQQLKALKKSDGGYGISAASGLEETHLVLEAFQLLQSSDSLDSLKQWLLQQQKEDGGFSVKGASNLADTYHAVWIAKNVGIEGHIEQSVIQFVEERKLSSGGYSMHPDDPIATLTEIYYAYEIKQLFKENNAWNSYILKMLI